MFWIISISSIQLRWRDGSTFEGTWSNYKMNGQGKFNFANGDVFEGNYVDDVIEGDITSIIVVVLIE